MSRVTLTLGGVAFRDMEVPEAIGFGGRQRVAVQELLGGGRAVQVLGVDEGVITFSGIFSVVDAAARAQLLDAARAAGATLPLVWDSFAYQVIVQRFAAEYRKANLIPFEIVCVVVNDVMSAVVAPVASLVAADLGTAGGFAAQAGVSLLGLGTGSVTGYAAAQAAVESVMSDAGAVVSGGAWVLDRTSDAGAAVSAINGMSAGAAQLAAAGALRGYVNRAVVNLGMAAA